MATERLVIPGIVKNGSWRRRMTRPCPMEPTWTL